MQVTEPQKKLLGHGDTSRAVTNTPGFVTKLRETLRSQMSPGCSSSTVRRKQLPTFLQAGTSSPCPSPVPCLVGQEKCP